LKAKNLTVACLLTIILSVSAQAVEDPKKFFTNGVNNDLTSAKKSAEKISVISGYGKYGVKVLHNSDISLGSDFWEAAKMSMNWDKFYTKLDTVNTANYTLNVLEEYKTNPRRTSSSDRVIVYMANIYAAAKNNGKDTLNFIAQIKKVRNSSLTHSITEYLQKIGLSWTDHAAFQRVKTEEIVAALGEVFSGTPEIFNPINKEYDDLNKMLKDVNVKTGDKISFIGHSQGNLYQNRIAEQLVASGKIEKNDIRVLSVATPANYVYNNGKYVTLEEDFVAGITFSSDLPANMSNLESTEYDDITMGLNFKNGDTLGHGFRETYLRDDTKSKKFIVDNFKKNFEDLKNSKDSDEDFYLEDTTISKFRFDTGEPVRFQTYIKYKGERNKSEIGTSYVVYFHYGKATGNKFEQIGYDRSSVGSDNRSDMEYVNVTFPHNYPSGYSILCALAYHSGYSDEENKKNNLQCRLFRIN